MKEILRQINRIAGVQGTILVGEDGLVIDSDMADGQDPSTLAAVASGVVAAMSSAVTRVGEGVLKRCILNGTEGSVVLVSTGGAIFLTLVRKDANMGMVLVELRDAAQKLATIMG